MALFQLSDTVSRHSPQPDR